MGERGLTMVELLVVVVVIGIIAAIGIPALLRARISANESATIGDIRSVVAAEATYHTATGVYGTLNCLMAPSQAGCIPSYPSNAPNFLDRSTASMLPKAGYNRSFEGRPVPGGLDCYTFHGFPSTPNITGVRSFAADCSGRICFTHDGAPVPTVNTELDPACTQLP